MLPAVTQFTVNFTIFCPTTDEEKGKLASCFKKIRTVMILFSVQPAGNFILSTLTVGKNVCLDVYLHEIKENQFLSPL